MNTKIISPLSFFKFKDAKDQTHSICVVAHDGRVWFAAKDIFETIGIKWMESKVASIVPEGWMVLLRITPNQIDQSLPFLEDKDVLFFNFKAVCKAAFNNKKFDAERFVNWVERVINAMNTGSDKAEPNQFSKTTAEDLVPLKDAIARFIDVATVESLSQAHKLLHKAFDVEDIDQIPKDKLHVAVTYVNGLIGEYIPYEKPKQVELPKGSVIIDSGTKQNILCALTHMICVGYWWKKHGSAAIRAINNNMGGALHDHYIDGLTSSKSVVRSLNLDTDVDYLSSINWEATASERLRHYHDWNARHA